MIDGTAYDAIVCAAEARAVPKIIKSSSKVDTSIFGQIQYHPSTIYLHRDESFMPRNKKEWRTWNVEMSSGRKEPQLTFWLNEFYPDAKVDVPPTHPGAVQPGSRHGRAFAPAG